jgi:hypothetical protein
MKRWDRRKAEAVLGIKMARFEQYSNKALQGYAMENVFHIDPKTPYKAAVGFHEMAHIVLFHTMDADSDPLLDCLHELEADATAIICLRRLGGSGIDAMREHYAKHRELWQQLKGDLPTNFKARVNWAARRIIEAGK